MILRDQELVWYISGRIFGALSGGISRKIIDYISGEILENIPGCKNLPSAAEFPERGSAYPKRAWRLLRESAKPLFTSVGFSWFLGKCGKFFPYLVFKRELLAMLFFAILTILKCARVLLFFTQILYFITMSYLRTWNLKDNSSLLFRWIYVEWRNLLIWIHIWEGGIEYYTRKMIQHFSK